MKLFLPTLLLMCCTVALAQTAVQDSASNWKQIIHNTRLNQQIDSLKSSFYQRSDSVRGAYKHKFAKVDSALHGLKIKRDSLSSLHSRLRKQIGLDSIQTNLKSRVDSITAGNNILRRITRSLDSINSLRESTIAQLNSKIQNLKEKTVGKLNALNVSPELKEKMSTVTSQINEFQIPTRDLDIPGLELGNNNLDQLGNLNLKTDLPELLPSQLGDLSNINGELSELGNATNKLGDYNKGIQDLTKPNLGNFSDLPNAVETKAGEVSGINEMKEQAAVLDKYKELPGKFQNTDSLKELAMQEVQNVALNHFSGKEQQLTDAMETLARYKSKYPNLSSISEATKRPPNEMKGKPLIERIVPGIGIQIQKKGEDLLVDFNPYAGYRFTTRITAGLGWNQRVAYNLDKNEFNPTAKIYGPRFFGEYKLWRGFSPRAEIEVMNTNVPPLTPTRAVDPSNREWILGAFVGLKKEYRFFKNIQGIALVMTRLLNPDHKSPYADVVNVRFGFEFPMKKKI